MARYLYKVFEDGELIGIMQSKHVEMAIGMPSDRVCTHANNGMVWHNKYRVEKYEDEVDKKSFSEEWNEITQRLLHKTNS